MWFLVYLAIVVVALTVHFFLGRLIWRALKELGAEVQALGRTSDALSLELSRVGAPTTVSAVSPRHGVDIATRA